MSGIVRTLIRRFEMSSDTAAPTSSSTPADQTMDDDEYEEEEEQPEEVLEPKVLPKRSTRAKRTTQADEADEEFWQQDAFQEENADDDYQQSDVSDDQPDSDFFESEGEESDEDEEGNLVKEKTKKRQAYVDPQRRKRGGTQAAARAAKRAKTESGEVEVDEDIPNISIAAPDGFDDTPAPKAPRQRKSVDPSTLTPVRKSKRSTTAERSAATQHRVKLYKAEPKIKREKTNYRIRSQAELLAEAQRTEVWNTESLRLMLAQEEDKKRVAQHRARYDGPAIVSLSTQRYHNLCVETISFTKTDRIPGVWNQPRPLPTAGTRLCPVNGLRPRYMDPATQIPFDSLSTFATIRQHTTQYAQVYLEQTRKLQQQRVLELQQEYQQQQQQFLADHQARATLRERRIHEGVAVMQQKHQEQVHKQAGLQAKQAKLAAREAHWRTITLDSQPTFAMRKKQHTTSTTKPLSVAPDKDVKDSKTSGRKTPKGRK